ncbi:MAG: hypothetical protein WD069_12080 [Planctomycetales bacterium]
MASARHSHPLHSLHAYAELEYLLLGDLRDMLEQPFDDENARWMLAVLDALLDTLPREFAIEEDGGYLREVVDEHPHWEPEVARLREQHEMLLHSLRRLRMRVAWQAPFAVLAKDVRRELEKWIETLAEHNRHENSLVQTAMNLEVGTGD